MNEPNGQKEILLIIDPQCIRQQSLDMAILLAERLKTGILAQLMSNSLLREVALLPFTTEILMSSGEERELHHDRVADLEERQTRVVRQFLEHGAGLHRVSCRLEQTSNNLSLRLALEHRRDLFLPPLRRGPDKPARANGIRAVNWVYDNCGAAERGLALLQELIAAGITRQVNLFANKPVPRQVVAALAERGARVCWVNVAGAEELLAKLQSGYEADLVILPASFTAQLGDARLRELNSHCPAPILVIG